VGEEGVVTITVESRDGGRPLVERKEVVQGQLVEWVSPSGHPLRIWFPGGNVFGMEHPDPSGERVLMGASPLDVDIEYDVYDDASGPIEGIGEFGEGNSHPVMIVRRP